MRVTYTHTYTKNKKKQKKTGEKVEKLDIIIFSSSLNNPESNAEGEKRCVAKGEGVAEGGGVAEERG